MSYFYICEPGSETGTAHEIANFVSHIMGKNALEIYNSIRKLKVGQTITIEETTQGYHRCTIKKEEE